MILPVLMEFPVLVVLEPVVAAGGERRELGNALRVSINDRFEREA